MDAQLVTLDASEHSSLKWTFEVGEASILWELDFALDEGILDDEARYLALELAVDHFTKTVWPKYEGQTRGVALYRGPFLESLLHPLMLLASHLPETVRPFVFLDVDRFPDATSYFRAVNPFTLGSLTPILKGKWAEKYPYAFPAFYPELPEKPLNLAVLIPEEGTFPIPDQPARMIPEQILTHEWDGVDYLLVDPASISDRCRRKLCGFEAAGGIVISSLDDVIAPQLQETSQPSSLDALH